MFSEYSSDNSCEIIDEFFQWNYLERLVANEGHWQI